MIEVLTRATSELKFFADMQKDPMKKKLIKQQNCCLSMKYEVFKKGKTIFNYKDFPQKFYIILRGSVFVFIPKEIKKLRAELEAASKKKVKKSDKKDQKRKLVELGGLSISELTESKKYYKNGVFKLFLVAKLTAGQMFGELGLMYGRPRAASIACAEDSTFVTLNSKDYNRIISSV